MRSSSWSLTVIPSSSASISAGGHRISCTLSCSKFTARRGTPSSPPSSSTAPPFFCQAEKGVCRILFNPIDLNPAVAARVVLPQSGRSRPEERLFFHIFPHFSKIEPPKKYLPPIGVSYIKLKLIKMPFRIQRKLFHLINSYICR